MSEPARIIAFPQHRRHPEPLLTLAELRALPQLGHRSERWWRYRIAEGCPVVRWGGTLRFRASEVEDWMGERYAS